MRRRPMCHCVDKAVPEAQVAVGVRAPGKRQQLPTWQALEAHAPQKCDAHSRSVRAQSNSASAHEHLDSQVLPVAAAVPRTTQMISTWSLSITERQWNSAPSAGHCSGVPSLAACTDQ